MTKLPPKQHDEFFKITFSDAEIARGYIRQFVNPTIVKHLNLNKLKLVPTSYITNKLKKYFADIVYSCPYKDDQLTISFLFEHKSRPVPHPHVQLLRYILEIWEENIKQKECLRVVLPLLFYHGREKWTYRPLADYFQSIDKSLLRYIPCFDYHLLNISEWSDEAIIALEETFLINTLLVLKHVWDENYIVNHIQQLCINLDQHIHTPRGGNLFEVIFVYLFKFSNIEEQTIKHMFEQIQPKLKDTAMNTYDRIVQKGYHKGISKGISQGEHKRLLLTLKNMHQQQVPVEKMSLYLGISIEAVKEGLTELKQQNRI